MVALEPFVPGPRDPWDAEKAAHLLRRTGFGPLPEEVAASEAAGLQKTLEALFAFPPEPPEPPIFDEVRVAEARVDEAVAGLIRRGQRPAPGEHPELRPLVRDAQRAHGRAIVALTAWWLDRMARTPAPLQEKLTLFWHGHFTTSFGDVHDAVAMFVQNQMFRRHAAGNFGRLLAAVARDPAMLRYLNNAENRKGHPNENWARELMELFTMGIGHYTETDVKESARAWTGWTLRDWRTFAGRRTFAFKPALHDAGVKTFLGHTGPFDGTDVMRIILAHPATPRWIADRLVRFFASPAPDPAMVDGVAQVLQDTGYELRPALEALFRSRAFYQPPVMYAQVKSPVEYVVGAVRHLGIAAPDWERLALLLGPLGQRLFFPPTVAGWRGGTAWVNAGTLFARADLAASLIAGRAGPPDARAWGSLDSLLARFLGRSLPPHRRAVLARLNGSRPTPAVVHLVMTLPEYHVA
jgi:uncharacterized protein (DUF1800 family)